MLKKVREGMHNLGEKLHGKSEEKKADPIEQHKQAVKEVNASEEGRKEKHKMARDPARIADASRIQENNALGRVAVAQAATNRKKSELGPIAANANPELKAQAVQAGLEAVEKMGEKSEAPKVLSGIELHEKNLAAVKRVKEAQLKMAERASER